MPLIEVGRLCEKIAGRDAGKECLIVDVQNKNYVVIDGNTRRRKCNISHLKLLPKKADIKKGAAHEEVVKALEKLGVKILPKAPPKEKKAQEEKPAEKKRQKAEKRRRARKTPEKA